MQVGREERRFAGAEESVQKRTNLILVETTGQSAQVLVRAYAATGEKLAEQTFPVGPSEYRQITGVFGDSGLKLGAGPFQNMEITAQVVSGTGVVLAVATVNDNVSRNPEILVLDTPGPPANPSIGF